MGGLPRELGSDETHELIEALVQALERRGHVDGTRLLDLMRMERYLQESLRIVRKEISTIVERAQPPPEPDDR